MNLLRFLTFPSLAAAGVVPLAASAAEEGPTPFSINFSQATQGSVPDGLFVLNGNFAVQEEGDNRFLQLPGAPLDSFGVLFGPNAVQDIAVGARIHTVNQGRKFSAFSVGLNGVAGFRLQVSPAKRAVELYHDDTPAVTVPYLWKPGRWTHLRLQVRKTAEAVWAVEGKVWSEGETEPELWTVKHAVEKAPYSGQASIWGKPFAGHPIRFDDLTVDPLPGKR